MDKVTPARARVWAELGRSTGVSAKVRTRPSLDRKSLADHKVTTSPVKTVEDPFTSGEDNITSSPGCSAMRAPRRVYRPLSSLSPTHRRRCLGLPTELRLVDRSEILSIPLTA